jgi:hypothetical protein
MRIGRIANVNGNHWVALVVDLRIFSILHGDFLRLSDNVVFPAFSWWAEHHTRRLFTKVPLSIETQSDSVSCGFFALVAFDNTPSAASQALVVAEASRPKRQFKEDVRQDRSKIGAPRKKSYEAASQTNWVNPLLWMTINQVASRCTGMSPAEVVRELHKININQFGHLSPQTIRQWIDRTGEVVRWSDKTMKRVERGNSPGELTTRVGVLVCGHLMVL